MARITRITGDRW